MEFCCELTLPLTGSASFHVFKEMRPSLLKMSAAGILNVPDPDYVFKEAEFADFDVWFLIAPTNST